jgi:hypothetical protein
MSAEEANALPDATLRTTPFFQPFRETYLHETPFMGDNSVPYNLSVEISYTVRSRIFADDLPSTSRAAGANPISTLVDANFDISDAEYRSGWPDSRPYDDTGVRPWLHSDFKYIAYYFNHPLWKKWVKIGDLNKDKEN